jgi:hypothetical protein
MMMRLSLYWTNKLCWIFIAIAHWNNSSQTNVSPFIIIKTSFIQIVDLSVCNQYNLTKQLQFHNMSYKKEVFCRKIFDSSPDRVKPKIIKLVIVASLLCTNNKIVDTEGKIDTPCKHIQSNLSYLTFQGNIEKQSHVVTWYRFN